MIHSALYSICFQYLASHQTLSSHEIPLMACGCDVMLNQDIKAPKNLQLIKISK